MRRKLHFEPSARLQSILSRELVADPNVAVLEFVKNGYDAGASEVLIDFDLGDHPREGILTIADDGEGMDLEEFQQNWMRPGYSEKASDAYRPRRGRTPAGEKGLGRLAAGRLGDVLDVYTRKRRNDPWLHARFVWADFEDMNQSLRDIKIFVDDETEPERPIGDTGTVVQISSLRLNWDGKVPGRKAPGRHPTRIGRLRQDLEMLLLPLAASGEPFEVWLQHNSTQDEDDPPGVVQAPYLGLTHYQYDFAVTVKGNRWQVKRVIRRGAELLGQDIAKQQGLKPKETQTDRLSPPPDGADLEDVGTFSGSFFYAPDQAEHLRRLRAPIGVLLYRDGVRVEPYGQPGNDWLGAQAKKASRQGYAAIQPAALYGAVHIARDTNPALRSQANREGLIENREFETFVAICRDEFSHFEDFVYDEYLTPRWQSLTSKRQKEAQASHNYAVSLTRTLMHSVHQPVAAANATLDLFQTYIDKQVRDATVRQELQDLHDRTASQLAQIGKAIRRVMEVVDFDRNTTTLALRALVEDIAAEAVDEVAHADVDVSVSIPADLSVSLPRTPVAETIRELVSNAVKATEAAGVPPVINIGASTVDSTITLSVSDNGEGIPSQVREELFERAASTTGGIGMGLILVRQLLRLIEGDLMLADTGPDGTEFRVTLPQSSE